MFVKSIMIPKYQCITIQEDETLQAALAKLEKYEAEGFPVLKGNLYTGMITKYMIYQRFFEGAAGSKEEYLSNFTAGSLAVRKDQFFTADDPFETVLASLRNFPIGAVVDRKGEFIGAVTRNGAAEQIKSAFGMLRPGIRIAFTTPETEGRIARLSEIAHQYREHIISLVTFDEDDTLLRRIVMKVEKKPNSKKFIKKLEEAGFRILDVREDE